MFDLRFARAVRLAKSVSCDAAGLFIGPIPLLERVLRPFQDPVWTPRSAADIESDLSDFYRFPIYLTAKLGGLIAVAHALNRGDLAVAHISALRLEFPDPPDFAKAANFLEARYELGLKLYRSGFLKEWSPEDHPRTGQRPNPGWFAEKPKPPKAPSSGGQKWPIKSAGQQIRDWLKKELKKITQKSSSAKQLLAEDADEIRERIMEAVEEDGEAVAQGASAIESDAVSDLEAADPVIAPALEAFGIGGAGVVTAIFVGPEAGAGALATGAAYEAFEAAVAGEAEIEVLLNSFSEAQMKGAKELTSAQLKSALQPAKTLEELQTEPQSRLGYDRHHIVEQHPENVKKRDLRKFGRTRIDDPDNTVWISRLRHEQVTAEFNRIPEGDTETLRRTIGKQGFREQRNHGLTVLRKFGLLK